MRAAAMRRHGAGALIAVLLLAPGGTHAQDASNCDSELLWRRHPAEYKERVCAGFRHMEKGRHKEAVRSFDAAHGVPLFEVPNHELFLHLAWARHLAGDREGAKSALAKERLSVLVEHGVLRCAELDSPPHSHVLRGGERAMRLVRARPKEADEVRRKMCGVLYESYYGEGTESIDDLLRQGAFDDYLSVKRRVEAARR